MTTGSTQPLAFIMLGFPGSGKSFVSDWLTEHMHAVHLRADDMRIAIFGEDKLVYHRNTKFQKQVHGAMHYAARQILLSKHSVIYDSNHNSVKSRRAIHELAIELGAIPIIIWVRAPLKLAQERVLEREAKGGHQVFEIEFVARMARNLEAPTTKELCIEIDGTTDVVKQQSSFDQQLAKIIGNQVQ